MNRRNKRLYRSIGIVILLVTIGFIVNDQLRKIGNSISGKYLKELISKESKGLYQIDYEYIDLNIFSKSVHISKLTLIATPKYRGDSINAKNTYEATVNHVKIKLESIVRIYTDKELVVDGIEIIDPKLYMTKINPQQEPLKFGRETGQLYEKISEYLDLLQVNYLKVSSGTVNHSPSNFQLNAIDFSINGFSVSQDQKKERVFYSEAINLGVSQQSILLPDSIHQLSFEGFELSTKDSLLNFTNFKISPRADIEPQEVFQKQKQNVYDIDIPILELKGINYSKAYKDNFLIVERVNIPKPKIKIHSVLKSTKQNTEQAENSIESSLLALFDLIQINEFKIQESSFNLTLKGDNQQRFLSDNISIDLDNIKLDSTQRALQNVIQYFEHASVEINDYDYLLPDNLHNIKFKQLNFNTRDSILSVQDLKVKPSRSLEDSTSTLFNLNLPWLEIAGIAPRAIYGANMIDLKRIVLKNAEIIITPPYHKNDSIQKDIITPHELHKILGQDFNNIKLSEFSLLNAHLNVTDIFSGKSLNIQSNFLQIDSTLNSWHSIADSTLIYGKELKYNFKKGQLKVASFQSNNNLHALDLTGLNFTHLDLGDQIKVENLSIKGVEFDSIINQKKFTIDSISIFKPILDISYKDFKQQSDQNIKWKFPDKPINILLKKGALKYQIDDYRKLNITSFDVEVNYQNRLKLLQVLANDLMMEDDKLKHQLYLSNLKVSKFKNDLLLKGIQIKPNKRNDSSSIDIKIPALSLINFNKDNFIQDKVFEADSMLLNISQLNYTGTENLKKHFNFSENNNSELRFAVQNSKIALKETNIFLLHLDNKTSQIVSADTKLTLQNLNFPKREDQNLFFAEDITIYNGNITYFNAENDTFLIKNLDYSSISKNGEIQDFSFLGSDSTTSLKIRNTKLKNTKLSDYIENNQLAIQEFSSEETILKLKIKKQDKPSLPQNIKLPFEKLKIEQLLSKDINIAVYHEENERDYHIRKANLAISSLNLGATLNPKKVHHHIKSLIFSGHDYRENFGKHYTIFAEDYTFRYPESSFEAANIQLRSKYDRFEYSEHINEQSDWFKLDLASLKLEQVNIDSLLINKKFIIDKLSLNKGDLTVFRDLNVPHNSDRIVPMPQTFLNGADVAFSIDSIFVNSDIHVQIVPKTSSSSGTITLNIDDGYIFNMRTHHFKSTKPMILKARGELNNKTDFNITVDFPMPSENSEYNFKGNIGPMDLHNLNDMLVPLGAVEIRSGYNEGVSINFRGNDEFSLGLMEFRYHNLKIDVLDRDTYQSSGFANNLKTIVANSFVIQSKNPRWFKLQEGNIFFQRDNSRSIFNFWAKSLLSGAVSSIGINKSKEEAKAYYREKQEEIAE